MKKIMLMFVAVFMVLLLSGCKEEPFLVIDGGEINLTIYQVEPDWTSYPTVTLDEESIDVTSGMVDSSLVDLEVLGSYIVYYTIVVDEDSYEFPVDVIVSNPEETYPNGVFDYSDHESAEYILYRGIYAEAKNQYLIENTAMGTFTGDYNEAVILVEYFTIDDVYVNELWSYNALVEVFLGETTILLGVVQ